MGIKGRVEKISVSPSYSFLIYCSCFVLGIFSFSWLDQRGAWSVLLYGLSLVVLFLLAYFWRDTAKRFIFFSILFFALGSLRMVTGIAPNNHEQITYYAGARKEITGWIASYPVTQQSSVRYYFQPDNFQGKVAITTGLYPKYNYGDHLKISCVLNLPENKSERFRYDKYLARYGAYVLCSNPKVEVLSGKGGNWWQRIIANWRSWLQIKIEKLWPSPESALMSGVLYGDASALPQEVKDSFSNAGVTHIVAVSGYNTSIVVIAVVALSVLVGFYKKQAFWLANFQLLLFVIFTGASASVVRAGIMTFAVLLAERMGRVGKQLNILTFTAAVMVLINPYILVWDAGFQLSFLSTIGIVYLNPIFSKKFERLPGWLLEPLSSTISAIVMTAPLLMYQFGRLSFVAPLANILILWIIPILMLAGMVTLLVGSMWFTAGLVFAWVADLGLKYVISVAQYLGGLSFASWQWYLPGWAMIMLYVIIGRYILKKQVQA